MTRARLLAVAAVLLALPTGLVVCGRVADRGRFAASGSTYGAGPEGARGAYLLADELGLRPRRWSEDLARLPAEGGVLVALGDCEHGLSRPVSRLEQLELRMWIERGGTLLVAGAREYLPDDFPLGLQADARCGQRGSRASDDEARAGPEPELGDGEPAQGAVPAGRDAGGSDDAGPERVGAAQPGDDGNAVDEDDVSGDGAVELDDARALHHATAVSPPLLGLPLLTLHDPAALRFDEVDDVMVLLARLQAAPDATEAERALGAVAPLGRGHVIVLASASPLQNRGLLDEHGGVLFARLLARYAPAGPVVFDEYHLGVGERRSAMRYLRNAGATPYVLQLLLVAALALLRAGTRFGAVLAPRAPAPSGTASFVASLGALFGRAADPAGVTQLLCRQALARVAAHHHLQGLSSARLVEQLQARGRAAAADAVAVIARPGALLASAGYDLVEVSERLDAAVDRACREPAPAV